MKLKSKNYSNVINIRELGRGGEGVVYRIEHSNLDEVVAKVALLDSNVEYN